MWGFSILIFKPCVYLIPISPPIPTPAGLLPSEQDVVTFYLYTLSDGTLAKLELTGEAVESEMIYASFKPASTP